MEVCARGSASRHTSAAASPTEAEIQATQCLRCLSAMQRFRLNNISQDLDGSPDSPAARGWRSSSLKATSDTRFTWLKFSNNNILSSLKLLKDALWFLAAADAENTCVD